MNAATATTTAINQGLKLGRQGAAGTAVGASAASGATGSVVSRVSGLSAIGSATQGLRSSVAFQIHRRNRECSMKLDRRLWAAPTIANEKSRRKSIKGKVLFGF